MAQSERPLYTLYKHLKAQNYDVPNDYGKFEAALTRDGKAGADNRHAMYQSLKAQNFDVPDSYERFYSALFEPRSKTSSKAKGGSVPMSEADKVRFSTTASNIAFGTGQAVKNASQYTQLKQRQKKAKSDFGKVNLGTNKTIFNGDADNVVKDIDGKYLTSDGNKTDSQLEAQAYQAVLDQQNKSYQEAVDKGDIPSVFDVRDKNGSYDLQENVGKDGTYVTDEGMQAQLDKKLADAYARKEELEKIVAADEQLNGNPLLSYAASVGAPDPNLDAKNMYNKELPQTALSLVKDEIGSLEAVKEAAKNSGWRDAWKALDNSALRATSWDFGVTDFATMAQMENIKAKIDKKLPLTDREKTLLNSKLGADAAAALEDEKTGRIYRWTKIAGQSLPFMLDFYLTGGYGGITKALGKAGIKYAAKRGMGLVGKNILKYTGVTAGNIIGSYAMAGSEQALKTGADVLQCNLGTLYQDENGNYDFGTFDENGNLLHKGGEEFGTALYKGLTSAAVENYTEKFFRHTHFKRFLGKKMAGTKLGSWLSGVGTKGWYANSKRIMAKFGIDGFGEEVMEEEIGIPLHAILDGDNKISDLGDLRQQMDIVGGMALSVGGMAFMTGGGKAAVKGIYRRGQYYRYKHKVDVSDAQAQQLFGDKWNDLKDKIDNATNEDMSKVLTGVIRSTDNMTKEQIDAAVHYGVNLMTLRGYNLASTMQMDAREATGEQPTPEQRKEQDIDDAYAEGHNAAPDDTHEIQLDNTEKQRTLAEMLGITEQQLSSMSNDELDSMTGQNDDLDRAIYDYQMSSARYQGVVDNANDDVDMAAQRASQAVDMYTDKSRGTVRNATIKATEGAEDYAVYIISGNIATHDDGSIDVSDSDNMILYFDPQTGKVEHADASRFAELGDENPADEVKSQAVADAKDMAIRKAAGIIDGKVEVGTQFAVTDADGNTHTYEVLADNGDGTAMITIDGNVEQNAYSFDDLQQMKDAEDEKKMIAARQQRSELEAQRKQQDEENRKQEEEKQKKQKESLADIIDNDGNVVTAAVEGEEDTSAFITGEYTNKNTGKKKYKVVTMDADGNVSKPRMIDASKVKIMGKMSQEEYENSLNAAPSAVEEKSGDTEILDQIGLKEGDNIYLSGDGIGRPREVTESKVVGVDEDGNILLEDKDGSKWSASAEYVNNHRELPPIDENTNIVNTDNNQSEKSDGEKPTLKFEDGTPVPMLEDGNPDTNNMTAEQVAEFYDNQFGDDAEGIIEGWTSDAKKALDKAKNMSVKGKNFVEQKASKDAKDKAIADAQAAYDSAKSIQEAYEERMDKKEASTPEGRKAILDRAWRKYHRGKNKVMNAAQLWGDTVGKALKRLYGRLPVDIFDTTPHTAEEYVVNGITPYGLNYEGNEHSKGVKQETGLSRKDFAGTHLLAAEGKGKTVDQIVHELYDARSEEGLDNLTEEEIRNAFINLITSGIDAYDMRYAHIDRKVAEAEKYLEEEQEAAENAAHMAEQEQQPSEEKTQQQPISEEDKLPEAEVPDDATPEKPLGEQKDADDTPFSARDNAEHQEHDERAESLRKNHVENMQVVDDVIGKKMHKALDRIAKMMGAKISWQYTDKKANGWYDESTAPNGSVERTIYLTLDSSITDGVQFIFGHEMTHEIKSKNPAAFEELKGLVKNMMGKDAFNSLVDDTQSKYENAGVSYSGGKLAYEEEVVADQIGHWLNDANYAHTLMLKMSHPLLAKLHEIVNIIRMAFYGTEYSDNAKLILRTIEQAYVKTANGTFESSANGGERYSLKDEEKAKRIEKLRESKPIEITGNEYQGKYELNRESAQKYLLDNLRGDYTIKDTGEVVSLARKGAKKVTAHSMGNEAHLKSIAVIPQLIENSIFIEEQPAYKDNAKYDSYRYYVTGIKIGGEDYTARLTIGVKNGKSYYDHYLTHIEKGNLIDLINQSNSQDEGFTPTEGEPNTSDALSGSKDTKLLEILQTNRQENDENVQYSLRQKPEPTKKGKGYKVFVLGKDGKLYPPMVANPNGEATPMGVWLDADAAPIVGESKTGRPQVKQGGKGTQGGSGKLAYRPGWHLGVIPYALQFNRKDAEGNRTLFPSNFVFAEVEYAADKDYQDEAHQEAINANGKYQHSLAGLKHLPTDGYYMYRTNPNPETDPWVITGAMKVTRLLTRAEQADIVKKAGREPQQIQEGDIVTDEAVNRINQKIADMPKFSLKVYHGSGADFTEFDFDHMGEGAGSQAFGWGGYVTSSEKIGKSYANLNRGKAVPDDVFDTKNKKAVARQVQRNIAQGYDKEETIQRIRNGFNATLDYLEKDEPASKEAISIYKEKKKILDDIESGKLPLPKMSLYEVNIPDDNGRNYLEFYSDAKPSLIEQAKKAIENGIPSELKKMQRYKEVERDYYEENGADKSFEQSVKDDALFELNKGKTIGDVYNALSVLMGDKLASQYLSSLGYTGIKYPAGTIMGGAEKGETNYVIFKPEDMSIVDHTKFSLRAKSDAYDDGAMKFSNRLQSAIDETETSPSDAQKESGNYKKGHVKFGGYDYTIENPKGSTRSGVDENGKPWSIKMHDTYGYIRGKFGKDGDHLDMFINDGADLDNWNGNVYVVDQKNPDGSFDEHKVMYGFDSEEEAKKAYLSNYEKGWNGLGSITGVSKEDFDNWVDSSKRKMKPFAEHSITQNAAKVPETFDDFLESPKVKFSIRNEEERKAANNAYDYATEQRPDKYAQYAIVDMAHPNKVPEYFEKKDLANKWRVYYNKINWGNFKMFDLNKPFADQVNEVKGKVPSEFDTTKMDKQRAKVQELEKQRQEAENAYKSKQKERSEYNDKLMNDYMDEHGLTNELNIPDDVWNKLRDESFEKYQEELDNLFNRYVDLDKQLKAIWKGTRFSLKDKEYLKAVEDGDMDKAQKMVNEAAESAGYSTDSSYQGTSAFNGAAPWGNAYFLTKEERKEAWDNDEFEGESTLGDYINDNIDGGNLEALTNAASYRHADPMRKEAIDNVRNVIQKKSKTITMYRSVPSDVKEGSFRNGDWVTPSRAYAVDNAKIHGWGKSYNIIEQKVPVDDVWFDGNDIAEWGYGREEDYANDTDFAYKNTENNKKLLDAVTYDDNGNVIPLSQRFNEKNKDVRFSLKGDERKQEQLNIVLRTNPMLDDYHTGIRKVEDIKTFAEVVKEGQEDAKKYDYEEWSAYPDETNELLQDALDSGYITIYSSKPIVNGNFVTPSRMQAEDYAGGEEVYEKTVPVTDVAWINVDEGQYARVEDGANQSLEDKPEGWKQANKKAIHIAEAIERDPKFSLKKLDGTLIKAGTYFSGGGLVEEGLKGIIDPVVAVEYDEKISGVYRNNFGQHLVTADVRDVDPKELVKSIDGEVEYFHASPVCKNYSKAKANHEEVELDKETAKSTADFVDQVRPKVVTIENVKGYRDSEAMKIITDALDRNGYKWDADVYNAADYGGYTNRERLIVRAVRDGELPEKPKKMERKKGWYEAVEDIMPTLTEKKNGVAPWMDTRLKADGIDWKHIDKPLYVMGSAYADGKVPHAFADELLPTLRTKSGDVIVMPSGKVYRASGRVLARISGVSDDYKMPYSEALSHTIIGNGIPTQLTEHVIAPLLTKTDPKFSIRTYHGTGADFENFDHSHIGEGEGLQAHGWGTYVTINEGAAKRYARQNSAEKNKEASALEWYGEETTIDNIMDDLEKSYPDTFGELLEKRYGNSYRYRLEKILETIQSSDEEGVEELENEVYSESNDFMNTDNDRMFYKEVWNKVLRHVSTVHPYSSNLYNVDIPDNNGYNYLEENKSYGQNTKLIKNINKALAKINLEGFNSKETISGRNLYDALTKKIGSKEKASKFLANLGLVGIHYYNANDGENYVIFDENNAKIAGHTKFSLRADQYQHDLEQWKKDNNLPKDAQRPSVPVREPNESAQDFINRVKDYRKQMALWKTAPTYEQHLLTSDTAQGQFNLELQRGSVLARIALQDSMLPIRKAQEAIMKEMGIDKLNMAEDAYTAENRSHGKGKNEFEEYNDEFLQPLRKAYNKMMKNLGKSYDNVKVYMMAKHGLERNAHIAFMKSLEADYEKQEERVNAYNAYKGDIDRVINDTDFAQGKIDFITWRQNDNAIRTKYAPSYLDYRYDDMGIAQDYSGLSALFEGSDFEEAAADLVKDVEDKHEYDADELWYATNLATKKILRDSYKAGMMTKEVYEYVRGMYKNYIPLRGWGDTNADQVWNYMGGGKGVFSQTLKKAKGRGSLADDPIAYIENMAESGILLNNKNWVKQHLLLLAENHPTSLLNVSKAWYIKTTDAQGNEEWIPASPNITANMTSKQVKAELDAFQQRMEQLAQNGDATQKRQYLQISYPQTNSEEREHEVRVMRNGEEYVIYVNGDPQLAQAVNNTRAQRVREGLENSISQKALAWLGRKMAAAYTSLSPLFIPSNFTRDTTMTLASTAIREDARYNYLLRKNMLTHWGTYGLVRSYQNGTLREKVRDGKASQTEQMFYDFMMNGGETGFVNSLDVEDLKKKWKNELKDMNRMALNPKKVGHIIMEEIETLNRAIEDSNRFAIYMTSIQYGRSIDEAVNDAKDVTLNFNRKGTGEHGWQTFRNLYLFINPAIQSLQTLGALAKHHPFKFTAVTTAWMASGMLVPMVNYALMSMFGGDDDKDKYWSFSKWDRRNNFIMWVPGTHEFIKIPLAQEFRGFYAVGDMIASKLLGGDKAEESWSDYGWDLMGQVIDLMPLDPTGYDGNLAVALMPNPIRPLFELAFNVDFTGKPLFKDSEYNKYDPNFTKAYAGTPDWLVRISRMVNSIGNDYPDVEQNAIDRIGDPRFNLNNPAVVDHVLSSYLGGAYTMGSQILGITTKALNSPSEVKMADVPLVSKFVGNPDDRPVAKKMGDSFWSMMERHDRAANTLSKLKKKAKEDGDYSTLEEFFKSDEYKQYKVDDKEAKKYQEQKKAEAAKETGDDTYQPKQLTGDTVYKSHTTPKDDFEDLKMSQIYTKVNGIKKSWDGLVSMGNSQANTFYQEHKELIKVAEDVANIRERINEIKKDFLSASGKDAYNAERMDKIRQLREKALSKLETANRVIVERQKAKANK